MWVHVKHAKLSSSQLRTERQTRTHTHTLSLARTGTKWCRTVKRNGFQKGFLCAKWFTNRPHLVLFRTIFGNILEAIYLNSARMYLCGLTDVHIDPPPDTPCRCTLTLLKRLSVELFYGLQQK